MQLARLTEAQSVYLDFVRGASALAVLVGHGAVLFLQGSALDGLGIESMAVLLFFLLSGFLISYSVFHRHADENYRFRDYFIDRFCRIYCAFIPALFFVLLVDMSALDLLATTSPEAVAHMPAPIRIMPGSLTPQTWLGNLFMLQDHPLFTGLWLRRLGSGGPFWTVALEWWLYMTFGMVAYFLCRAQGTGLRLWQWAALGFVAVQPFHHLSSLTQLWGLGMVACFAFLRLPAWLGPRAFFQDKGRWRRLTLTAFTVSGFGLLGRLDLIKQETGVWILAEPRAGIYLGCALFSLLLVIGSCEGVGRGVKKAVTFLADISYSLYLTHATVIIWLFTRFPGHERDPAFFLLAVSAALVTAVIFWWLFERHHRALAGRLKVFFRGYPRPDLRVKAG